MVCENKKSYTQEEIDTLTKLVDEIEQEYQSIQSNLGPLISNDSNNLTTTVMEKYPVEETPQYPGCSIAEKLNELNDRLRYIVNNFSGLRDSLDI